MRNRHYRYEDEHSRKALAHLVNKCFQRKLDLTLLDAYLTT